jgi:type VI secretion system protein ImpC
MTESIQKKLLRVRPPRVKIMYDVETGGAIEKIELPFVIAVLADLSGNRAPNAEVAPLKTRQMMALDRDNFEAVMAQHQPLEATRRGLQHLVMQLETNAMLQIKVLDATKQELLRDLQKAVAFDQSVLFKRLYESTYGSFGGMPFSLLLGDYEIGRNADDIDFLTKMSQVAAAAHAPFITSASAALFDLNSFDDLDKPRDLSKIFESADMVGWNEFRASEDSRYVALTLPRVALLDTASPNSVWFSAVYLLAARIGRAFSQYAWPVLFGGFEDDGLAPEVEITVHRAQELGQLGFVPLCVRTGTTQTAFIGTHSSQLPKKFTADDANANAKISALLPYMLATSRFTHYVKVIMRDKIGSFLTRGNVEAYLNTWISQYVLLDDNASEEAKAAFPLRQASIVVTDVAGSPGAYQATIFIKPHFQMEALTTSIRLVASLPG